MKRWLVLALLTGIACAQSIMQDQNTVTWGKTGYASGTTQKYPDLKGTITNQFEVLVNGTAPASLTVTVAGCMRGGTCSATLVSSSGTGSQLLVPGNAASNIYDYYNVTTSWTGGDATTQFVINRTGTVARLPTTGGGGTVNPNNVAVGATTIYPAAGGSTTVGPSSVCTDNGTTLTCAHIDGSPIGASTQATGKFTTLTASSGLQLGTAKLLISAAAPTISSGFGTSPTITANNGTGSFTVNVGTGGTATSGVIALPAATVGWNCSARDLTTQSSTVFMTQQITSSTTTVTIANFNTSGAQAAWVASDIVSVNCFAD